MERDWWEALGERMRRVRVSQGRTQQDIASMLDCFRESYVLVEHGRRKLSAKELASFCTLTGVSPSYLLWGESNE